MAYEGEIEYINIKNDYRHDFQKNQISFPSAESSQSGTGLDMELRELVRGLKWEDMNEDGQQLTFDGETSDKDNKTCAQELKLAIVGRGKLRGSGKVWVYGLIIKPCSVGSAYERVGVGYVREIHISDVPGVMVRVI